MKTGNAFVLVCIALGGAGCAAEVAGDEAADFGAQSTALESDRLLALGDSIAFGYNPFGNFTKDKNFVGYPEVLKNDHEVGGLKNSSCPGESSGSFISATAPDNGCRAYRAAYPLHVNYGNKATQLEYALSRLTSAEPEDVPTVITLNVSGNDIFLLQKACATDPNPAACFAAGAPALIGSIATNVGTILATIRTQGGYQGRIIYQNLYTVDYSIPSTVGFVAALNNTVSNVARQFGAEIADAFGAFGAASAPFNGNACTAGLLIPLPSGAGCDVHPSAAGAALLAQSVVNAQP